MAERIALFLLGAAAEANANRIIAAAITPALIQMREAEARMEHGWVTVQGTGGSCSNSLMRKTPWPY